MDGGTRTVIHKVVVVSKVQSTRASFVFAGLSGLIDMAYCTTGVPLYEQRTAASTKYSTQAEHSKERFLRTQESFRRYVSDQKTD